MNWKRSLLVCVIIAAIAAGLSWLIYSTEPAAERSTMSKRTAMLVDTVTVERGTYRPQIVVMGVVRARDDVALSPRVSGEVLQRLPAFEPGNLVAAGELLLKLDPADYENTVAQRRSALHQAEADLELEMGRQRVAKLDYELLGDELGTDNASLVLREPQLEAAKADVEAAQADLDQALLDLERTTVRAPFEAMVLSRDVGVGSQVSAGESLGRLVSVDSYWVTATVPLDKLSRIQFADTQGVGGSAVTVRSRATWPTGATREGRVDRLIGALDENTRLARVNVVVDDPLARSAGNAGESPLIIGALLEVTIDGAPLDDVLRLDRSYLREDNTVWVNDGGELRIVAVEVVFSDAQYVYIRDGLADGAAVVTTGLSAVVEGAPLRTEGEGGNE
ncbi:efflux RND transporter periplasmic adaptor subunit [Actomonas aquatica]|uniref:Efflux RND transporter periplasmic adaptor subunit n=1 Tax=Actomonas aquatica TaxID=2866162 RepID=A0ABZ1CAS4_9BACT|nr:efflux RND transporter periplasmic adaptor subunit [Opitutus sp. WL0086]WRQ88750.1 efflux RND transporter periplasmic adaptor subunit [Opitutus sp. WL0086]